MYLISAVSTFRDGKDNARLEELTKHFHKVTLRFVAALIVRMTQPPSWDEVLNKQGKRISCDLVAISSNSSENTIACYSKESHTLLILTFNPSKSTTVISERSISPPSDLSRGKELIKVTSLGIGKGSNRLIW